MSILMSLQSMVVNRERRHKSMVRGTTTNRARARHTRVVGPSRWPEWTGPQRSPEGRPQPYCRIYYSRVGRPPTATYTLSSGQQWPQLPQSLLCHPRRPTPGSATWTHITVLMMNNNNSISSWVNTDTSTVLNDKHVSLHCLLCHSYCFRQFIACFANLRNCWKF